MHDLSRNHPELFTFQFDGTTFAFYREAYGDYVHWSYILLGEVSHHDASKLWYILDILNIIFKISNTYADLTPKQTIERMLTGLSG